MLDCIIVICIVLFSLAYITKVLLQKYEIDAYWCYTFRHVIAWILYVVPDVIFVCLIFKLIIWVLKMIF